MTCHNGSTFHPITFFLIGIPRLEEVHGWISLPFCFIYIVALLGNVTILLVIKMDQTLREPRALGFPGGSHGKEPARNAGDLGSIPGLAKVGNTR